IGPDPRNFNQRVNLGRNDLLIRTFLNEDALITLPSGEIVAISNQWGIVNIELLIEFVRQNGFVVEKAEQ
ncbi:hypothetical protein, partial [Escherichia coli]